MPRGIKKLLQSEPAVIERWVKIRSVRTGRRIGRRVARPRIWLKERRHVRDLELAFATVREQAVKLEQSNYPATRLFMNIALFILVAERDICAVKLDALTHPDKWKRSVALRTILLTIYEWDMDKVAGRRLREAMDIAKIDTPLREEVTTSLRNLRKTQSRAKKAMHKIRNATIAHRDPDALVQYRMIRDIDSAAVLELAAEFYESAQSFIAVVPRLIASGSNLPSLVRQMGRTID